MTTEPTVEEYVLLENRLKEAVALCEDLLSDEEAAHLQYYMRHDEIEMAYEGFCLSIFNNSSQIPKEAKLILLPLGIDLGLDKESIYDPEFWHKAQTHFNVANQ